MLLDKFIWCLFCCSRLKWVSHRRQICLLISALTSCHSAIQSCSFQHVALPPPMCLFQPAVRLC